MIHQNPATNFCNKEYRPEVDSTAFIHPLAAVIGHTFIGKKVMVSPFASVRGDEGNPIFIGDGANIQDGVVIHGLETESDGQPVESNLVSVDSNKYSVYVGQRVSLAHQVQIHGPAFVGDDTFVGMKALVFKAKVSNGCVLEPGCILMGVTVEAGRYVPAGTVLKNQQYADNLPRITEDYPLKNLNKGVVHVNTHLAEGYSKIGDLE
ncbi:MAG: carbonic anhydrase [Desulfobacterales bacterium]|nr:carbonic anhydrase [Deltaproteobacteria bacterium]NNL42545.1 carbonic anhydrase [Desulfobacterales bacterium]